MPTLLQVKSSILGHASQSGALADEFVQHWREVNPQGRVIVRDLGAEPVPHLDGQRLAALTSDAAGRTSEQQAVLDLSDTLVQELRDADVVVLGVPMYNFSIPSQMKAWFDHVARAGVTFRYTESGPQGLLADRPVMVFATRGGIYNANGIDYQTPFLEQFFNMIGLKDLHFVHAEGLAMGDEPQQQALDSARNRIRDLVKTAKQAA